MLGGGAGGIDRDAVEMGELAFGDARADRPGEGAAHQRLSSRTIAPPFITSRTAPRRGDVARRIAVDGDEVGEQAGPDRAAVGEAEEPGIARGGGDQHVGAGASPSAAISSISRALSPWA